MYYSLTSIWTSSVCCASLSPSSPLRRLSREPLYKPHFLRLLRPPSTALLLILHQSFNPIPTFN